MTTRWASRPLVRVGAVQGGVEIGSILQLHFLHGLLHGGIGDKDDAVLEHHPAEDLILPLIGVGFVHGSGQDAFHQVFQGVAVVESVVETLASGAVVAAGGDDEHGAGAAAASAALRPLTDWYIFWSSGAPPLEVMTISPFRWGFTRQ